MTHGLHPWPTYHQPHYSSSDIAAHHNTLCGQVWPVTRGGRNSHGAKHWAHYPCASHRHAGLTSAIVSNADSAMAANKTLGTQGTACHCDTILMVVK